jgi:aminoacylase
VPVVSDECVAFFRRQAVELDLPIQIYEMAAGKPIVIITLLGEEPGLPSLMLNSHMDVVPVYEVGLFL